VLGALGVIDLIELNEALAEHEGNAAIGTSAATSDYDNGSVSEITERLIAVNLAPIQTRDIRTELSFTGQVRASAQIAVVSRVQGIVDEVMFNVGDFVNEGDVLFTMDESDLQANIRSLNAQLSTADAAVNAARTGVSLADGIAVQSQILQTETAVIQAEAGIMQAQLGVEQRRLAVTQAQNMHYEAQTNMENMQLLLDFGDIPRVQFEQAESAVSNAAIGLEQAKSALEMAEASLDQARSGYAQARESNRLVTENVRSESVRRAQDGLVQAEAQRNAIVVNLDAARERLNDASITAPISGVISTRGVEPQTMMLPNVAPFTIVSIETVLVHVNVTENIINRIEQGQYISVSVAAASDIPFTGQVVTVSPVADPMTASFSVEIALDNSEGLLRPGMFAEAFFVRDESENTIVVPRSAVMIQDGVTVVYIAVGENAVRREVTVGIDSGAEIEITEGVEVGDMLIVRGQTFVRDGSPLYIVETENENGGGAN